MLLSKRPEMFCPDLWPAYYKQAKGIDVIDLDGRRLIDMSLMGVGTNILGYCHPDVDSDVISAVNRSTMSTLNCPEEVYLAEKLVDMHPWADMCKFARSGGEANAIATRIARAASGRDKIAICGYHGWHDWYLSSNLTSSNNLSEHLLPGLDPLGVPRHLADSVHTFSYNDLSGFKQLISNHEIGVVYMEMSVI